MNLGTVFGRSRWSRWRRCCFCFGSRGSWSRGLSLGRGRGGCAGGRRRSSGRRGAFDFQFQDQVAGTDFLVQLDFDALDNACCRRRDLHAGLVGFQGDQRLIGLDAVTDLDHQFDDLGLARRTDVRYVDVLNAGAGCRSRLGGGRRCRCRFSRLFGSSRGRGRGRFGSRCRGRSRSRFAFHFQFEQLVAFFQAVTQLDLHGLDDASLGSRDFHARLVRLKRQNALVGFDAITDLDHQFNDFAFTVADVGYTN